MMKFFKNFVYTRHPTTINWLIEILYILSTKFKPEDSKTEKKVKAEYQDLLELLLKSATQIIQDTFGTKYNDSYGLGALAFSPTFYEMIKRYEFVKSKHPEVIETDQNASLSIESNSQAR